MRPRPTILVPDRRTTRSMIVRWPCRRSFVQFVRRTKLVNVFSYYLFFLYIHYCRIYLSIKSLRCADTKMLSSSAFTFYTHVRYRLSTRSNGYAPSLYRMFSKSGATTEQATIRREKVSRNWRIRFSRTRLRFREKQFWKSTCLACIESKFQLGFCWRVCIYKYQQYHCLLLIVTYHTFYRTILCIVSFIAFDSNDFINKNRTVY